MRFFFLFNGRYTCVYTDQLNHSLPFLFAFFFCTWKEIFNWISIQNRSMVYVTISGSIPRGLWFQLIATTLFFDLQWFTVCKSKSNSPLVHGNNWNFIKLKSFHGFVVPQLMHHLNDPIRMDAYKCVGVFLRLAIMIWSHVMNCVCTHIRKTICYTFHRWIINQTYEQHEHFRFNYIKCK